MKWVAVIDFKNVGLVESLFDWCQILCLESHLTIFSVVGNLTGQAAPLTRIISKPRVMFSHIDQLSKFDIQTAHIILHDQPLPFQPRSLARIITINNQAVSSLSKPLTGRQIVWFDSPPTQTFPDSCLVLYTGKQLKYADVYSFVLASGPPLQIDGELYRLVETFQFKAAAKWLTDRYDNLTKEFPLAFCSALEYSPKLIDQVNSSLHKITNYREKQEYMVALTDLLPHHTHPAMVVNRLTALRDINRIDKIVTYHHHLEHYFGANFWNQHKEPQYQVFRLFESEIVSALNQAGQKFQAIGIAERMFNYNTENYNVMHTWANMIKEIGQPNEAYRMMYNYYMKFRGKMPRSSRLSYLSNMALNSMYTDFTTPANRLEVALEYSNVLELDQQIRWLYQQNQQMHQQRLVNRINLWNSQKSPIKLGYISSDFKTHPCGYMAYSLIDANDPKIFQITLYSTNPQINHMDPIYQRFVKLQFPPSMITIRHVHDMSNKNLSQLIMDDEIDILIEMSGHTRDCRLDVMATSPAPIIVSYFAFPSTTGLRAVTHKITDHVCSPHNIDRYYTERLIRLPRGFQCYSIDEQVPAINRSPIPPQKTPTEPASLRLGCFNNPSKYSPTTYRVFSEILNQLPSSKLIMGYGTLGHQDVIESMKNQFKSHGLKNLDQLEFGTFPRNKYLDEYNRVHLALDTIPYCGGTISSEALMMSTPLVTLQGDDYVSRVGASLLYTLGYPELVTTCEQHYIQTVVDLAYNSYRLNRYHNEIRSRMEQTELLNPQKLQAEFMMALRRVWHRYLSEELARIKQQKQSPPNNQTTEIEPPIDTEQHHPQLEESSQNLSFYKTPANNVLDVYCPYFSSKQLGTIEQSAINKFNSLLTNPDDDPPMGKIEFFYSKHLILPA